MADLLADAMQWLADQEDDHLAQTITYTNASGSVTLVATVGQTRRRVTDNGRSRLIVSDRDYLVMAADLRIGGSLVTPAIGDRITDGSETYDVFPFAGEPHYRRSDPDGIKLRIHTKRNS